ncbi:MAG: hypothetical protein Q9172_007805, partial [Xanthocarpia lactea]
MAYPYHHPLGPNCPSTRLGTQQAQLVGIGRRYNSSLDTHGIGRHQGQTCPHRIRFDAEASTPGTELYQAAQERGGICNDELWLRINELRRRAAVWDGNDGYGIRFPDQWDHIMDRIMNAAPWEEACGPYGLKPKVDPRFGFGPGFGRGGRGRGAA